MQKRFIEENIIDKIMQRHHISKNRAMILYKNSLLYNTVVDEILEKVDFLIYNKIELL